MSSYVNIMFKMARVKEGQVDTNYHKYLTEKLDRGEPNVVVDSAIRLVTTNFFQSNNIRIADFGCFTGSIIDRVYLLLPERLRQKVNFFGFDNDPDIVKEAELLRPHMSFSQHNFIENNLEVEPFQIGILSNVLHEIYSLKVDNKREAKKLVTKSLKNIQKFISIGGFLIILDGILPDKQEEEIDIVFLQKDYYSKFIQFAESGYCVAISYKKVDERIVRTTLGGLATFLVKSRYLDTTFWEQESYQVYNYFTKEDFKEVLFNCGFIIEKQDVFEVPNINENIKILNSSAQIPFKNTLIVAKRIN